MTYTDVTLADALSSIIANTNPAIVPVTTLAATATAGDQTITIAPLLTSSGQSRFLARGWVKFDDGSVEETLDIKNVSADGATLTLDFTGLGYAGLQHTHASGAVVYTNLDSDAPIEVAAPMILGDPVIAVMVTHEDDHWQTMGARGGVKPVYTAHIEYFRRLTIPAGETMSPNRWAKRQQRQARADLETITATIRANRGLISNHAPAQAIELGMPGKPMFTRDWGRLTRDANMQIFAATLDVIVQGEYVH